MIAVAIMMISTDTPSPISSAVADAGSGCECGTCAKTIRKTHPIAATRAMNIRTPQPARRPSGPTKTRCSCDGGGGVGGACPTAACIRSDRHGIPCVGSDCANSGRADPCGSVGPTDIVLQNLEKFGDDVLALERDGQLPVDIHRGLRLLKGARQRDPDVGVLGFPRPIHDASHHCHPHVLDTGVLL